MSVGASDDNRALVFQLTDALATWLPTQRWFAAKDRPIARVEPVSVAVLHHREDEDPVRLEHTIQAVSFADNGEVQLYQLFVGYRRILPERLQHVRIADVQEDGHWLIAFDGLWDDELASSLLPLMASGETRNGVQFATEPGMSIPKVTSSRVVDTEQTNTSVIYDDAAILKVFRRLVLGTNPDLELCRALRRVGCPYVPGLLGSIEGGYAGEQVTYAMLSAYAVNSADGWSMATASVRDLIAEQDLRAHEVGGDFAAEAYRLGEAVAAVHGDLATALGTSSLNSDGLVALSGAMSSRLDAAIAVVPALAQYAPAVRTAFEAIHDLTPPVPVQRVHGDLHLGQVLRTPTGWLLIDFEGEPAKPLSERLRPDSVLRDVAGMLRSFDYAAQHLLLTGDSDHQREYRALEWTERNRAAFCSGYAAVSDFNPAEQRTLLRAYELDKAVYEAVYERQHRPAWVEIPLRSIARLTQQLT
mgnify:CR=1 FL=1